MLAPGEMEMLLAGQTAQAGDEVWTARGNAEPADPTGLCPRSKVSPRPGAIGLLQGCNRPAATQRLRRLQPRTKVFPVQPHVHPGTDFGGPADPRLR